jgi:hypothetical protein
VQHGEFEVKRKQIFAASNLHLNRQLMVATSWNEAAVEERGQKLFDLARNIYRAPVDY